MIEEIATSDKIPVIPAENLKKEISNIINRTIQDIEEINSSLKSEIKTLKDRNLVFILNNDNSVSSLKNAKSNYSSNLAIMMNLLNLKAIIELLDIDTIDNIDKNQMKSIIEKYKRMSKEYSDLEKAK